MLMRAITQPCRRLHAAWLRLRITAIEQDTLWLESAMLALPAELAANRAKAKALRERATALEASR
jgi:hypothetical protein